MTTVLFFVVFLLFLFLSNRQHANLAGTLSGHGSWVLSVAFSPDNSHFASRYSISNHAHCPVLYSRRASSVISTIRQDRCRTKNESKKMKKIQDKNKLYYNYLKNTRALSESSASGSYFISRRPCLGAKHG